MYEEIAKKIAEAIPDGNKSAMFHFQVLKNAHQLAGVEPLDFCRRVGVRDSYVVEFHKMVKVEDDGAGWHQVGKSERLIAWL